MEIQYIRKLRTSYMVLPQAEKLNEWEEKMISHAAPVGVIFAECICEDGRSSLWYDITGKQSLDVVLEGRNLDYDTLCQILLGLYESAEGLEDILFCAENMLLFPENIFLNLENGWVYFCYYPQSVPNIQESFLQLMEFFLIKLNHEDDKAVELAYHLYEQAEKGEWSLRELKKSIVLTYQAEEEQKEKHTEYGISEKELEEAAAGGIIENEKFEDKNVQKKGLEVVFRKGLEGLKKRMQLHLPDSIAQCMQIFQKPRARVEKEKEERFVFEPEEEAEENVIRPTVMVEQLKHPIEGVLRYEGNGACENLIIEGEEYVIGSEQGCAGYIPNHTVSRRHAKISQIGGVYMIEDLNSLNGTYVGGTLLNYRTKTSLHKNEVIIFADEKFRFI